MKKYYLIDSLIPGKVMSKLTYVGEASILPSKEVRGGLYHGEITDLLPNHYLLDVDIDFKGTLCVATYILNLGVLDEY